MTLYAGIDIPANNSVVVILNEQDQVMYQQRLANHLPTILEQLAPYHTEIKGVVVESTYNWYWLVDGLMDADYRVHLANTAAIKQYEGLKYTDDPYDAIRRPEDLFLTTSNCPTRLNRLPRAPVLVACGFLPELIRTSHPSGSRSGVSCLQEKFPYPWLIGAPENSRCQALVQLP